MLSAVLGVSVVAIHVGFGVYRSCTAHLGILRMALLIDLVSTSLLIGWFWSIGIFG